jgi:hypothetical protein
MGMMPWVTSVTDAMMSKLDISTETYGYIFFQSYVYSTENLVHQQL